MILSTPDRYRKERGTPPASGIIGPRDGVVTGPRAGRALRLAVTRPDTGIFLVRMCGEIDLSSIPRLRELIRQRFTAAYLTGVVLDLTTVSFCDASGVEMLLEAQQRAERRGITLLVIIGDGAVGRLLDLTALTDRFTHRDNTAEAIAELRQ